MIHRLTLPALCAFAASADPAQTDALVAATVEIVGDKGFASDGIEADSQGYIYLTDYEHNAVKRRSPTGEYETIVSGPSIIWPDSIAFGPDGYMYFTAEADPAVPPERRLPAGDAEVGNRPRISIRG